MRLLWLVPVALFATALPFAYAHEAPPAPTAPQLPPGSNEVLRAVLAENPDLEVIISDVIIPPNQSVPRHYHPGQEFLYLIEGTAVHVEQGQPDRPLKAGDTYVIPPRAIHSPRGGPNGARAIVFRVHVKGEPERIAAPE
jgi:quercetin dioxygenase-like cupin family protein